MDSAVIEERRDANGIPIRQGYRPPFTRETALAAARESARVRRLLKAERDIAREAIREIKALLKRPKRGSKPSLQKPAVVPSTMVSHTISPVSPVPKSGQIAPVPPVCEFPDLGF